MLPLIVAAVVPLFRVQLTPCRLAKLAKKAKPETNLNV